MQSVEEEIRVKTVSDKEGVAEMKILWHLFEFERMKIKGKDTQTE